MAVQLGGRNFEFQEIGTALPGEQEHQRRRGDAIGDTVQRRILAKAYRDAAGTNEPALVKAGQATICAVGPLQIFKIVAHLNDPVSNLGQASAPVERLGDTASESSTHLRLT